MKGLWKEFKAFIFRGNVVDMAIGVIVASAFTAIVNGLSTYVLKPLVNWVIASLIGADSLAFLSHEVIYKAGHRDDLCLACFNHQYPTKLY